MGKLRKRFNQRARQQTDIVIDRDEEKKILVDIEAREDQGYDDCNTLVLPSMKRKTKKINKQLVKKRNLTKQQRRHLQRIVDAKKKKLHHADLLKELSQVQASTQELMLLKESKRKLKSDPKDGFNIVHGSKKQRKQQQVKEEGESEEASSIDTSDVSTDDEGAAQAHCTIDEKERNIEVLDETKDDFKIVEEKMSQERENNGKEKPLPNRKPAIHIAVQRKQKIQAARLKLPILSEEQVIMETINENPVVIICGETGSGKTTQVPQFLYEAGYTHKNGIIGVTEPRRIAAVSMSQRVAEEMNLTSREVSYQIRYEGNSTEDTKIKFMTDGVLLKEVQQDFLLTKYSVVILDEAHERNVYTDILIGLLSRIVPLRNKKNNPMKLIIMSATLRVEDFTENKHLFNHSPPVVKVESRQFPVTIHFNRRTPLDSYLNEVYRKTCKIHQQLPEGGILVFVTGQLEVHSLCQKLKQMFPYQPFMGTSAPKSESRKERKQKGRKQKTKFPNIHLDSYSVLPVDNDEEMEAAESSLDLNDEDELKGISPDDVSSTSPLYVLPLFSLLSGDKQARVFKPPPEGCRLCIVATNVAETSLTIPNIKYVVDCGKVKTKFYDKVTGISKFQVVWTSKASANQRAGRAGRTGPGHCYRLYSSTVFNDDFEKFSPPEITRKPVEDIILQMKDMCIERVMNFPFPTSPDMEQIKAAERLLISLGALTRGEKPRQVKDLLKEPVCKITSLGRQMACFPLSPRYAKMLVLGHQHGLLPYVVAIVSALSVPQLLHTVHKRAAFDQKEQTQQQYIMKVRRMWAGSGHSLLLGDAMLLLKALGSCEYHGFTSEFCKKHGIQFKMMKEVRKLRAQLTNTVNVILPDVDLCIDPKMAPPSDLQAKLLRQIILAGMTDHVARFNPCKPSEIENKSRKMENAYQSLELEEPVWIHPTSILYKKEEEYVVYQYIEESESSRLYMKGITAIEAEWLPSYAAIKCTFSKPMDHPPPSYDNTIGKVVCHMTGTYGRCAWPFSAVQLEFPDGLERYKWFARFLLEGAVIPKLKKFQPLLLTPPSVMVKSWASLHPRTDTLLRGLLTAQASCRDSLIKAWNKDDHYLLYEFCQWLPEDVHSDLKAIWPPLV